MTDIQKIVDELSKLTVVEAAELAELLKEKWGVSTEVPVPVAAVGKQQAEEKTSFNVVLDNVGAKKISVIKEVRAITGLGLSEAKAVVDAAMTAPKEIKAGVKKEEAEEIKSKLEKVGAKVSLT